MLVLIDLSTLGSAQSDSISNYAATHIKRTMTLIPNRIDTLISLCCQVAMLFYRAARAKSGYCLTTNDNLALWFLVKLLQLLCKAINCSNTVASLGLLRIVANLLKTLNAFKRHKYSLKVTNEFWFFYHTIPNAVTMGSEVKLW